jgi:hypothetical protein
VTAATACGSEPGRALADDPDADGERWTAVLRLVDKLPLQDVIVCSVRRATPGLASMRMSTGESWLTWASGSTDMPVSRRALGPG